MILLAPYKTPTDLNNYKLLNVKTFGGSNNDNNDDDEYNHFFFIFISMMNTIMLITKNKHEKFWGKNTEKWWFFIQHQQEFLANEGWRQHITFKQKEESMNLDSEKRPGAKPVIN